MFIGHAPEFAIQKRDTMAVPNDNTLLFVVEWFDPLPQMKKQYLLKFFVDQHNVEMVDLKFRKIFLRKSPCPNELSKDDFFVGGKISLYSRELEIVDYGDLKTKEKLHFQVQQSVAILTQSSYNDWGKLITQLTADMTIVKMKTVIMPQNMADRVCGVLNLGPRKSLDFSNGVSLVILLHGADGFNKTDRVIKEAGELYVVKHCLLSLSDFC